MRRRRERIVQVVAFGANTYSYTRARAACALTCSLIFTFGGLNTDTCAHVINTDGAPIPGLFAAGDLVDGLFYFNDPGGAGRMNDAVFCRINGATAGQHAGQLP